VAGPIALPGVAERERRQVAEFDEIVEHYDATRGGEQRGDDYSSSTSAQWKR
jgi:hypothetical protein